MNKSCVKCKFFEFWTESNDDGTHSEFSACKILGNDVLNAHLSERQLDQIENAFDEEVNHDCLMFN